jgi:hypothetical protein
MDFNEMAKDEYNSAEETQILHQLATMEEQSHAGALFEDMKRHPAYQKLERYMESFISDSKNTIFNDPEGDHRKMIFQVQGMIRVRNWVNAQILAGHIASKGIKTHFDAVQEEKQQLGIE